TGRFHMIEIVDGRAVCGNDAVTVAVADARGQGGAVGAVGIGTKYRSDVGAIARQTVIFAAEGVGGSVEFFDIGYHRAQHGGLDEILPHQHAADNQANYHEYNAQFDERKATIFVFHGSSHFSSWGKTVKKLFTSSN